jgi:hypothetical protein
VHVVCPLQSSTPRSKELTEKLIFARQMSKLLAFHKIGRSSSCMQEPQRFCFPNACLPLQFIQDHFLINLPPTLRFQSSTFPRFSTHHNYVLILRLFYMCHTPHPMCAIYHTLQPMCAIHLIHFILIFLFTTMIDGKELKSHSFPLCNFSSIVLVYKFIYILLPVTVNCCYTYIRLN